MQMLRPIAEAGVPLVVWLATVINLSRKYGQASWAWSKAGIWQERGAEETVNGGITVEVRLSP